MLQILSWFPWWEADATYGIVEIMKYETNDLGSNPGAIYLYISIPFMPHSTFWASVYSLYLAYGLLGRLNKTVQQFPFCELQTPGHLWPFYKMPEKAYTREKESFRDLRLKTVVKSSGFK